MKSKAHGYEGHLLLSFINSDHMMSTRVLPPGIDSLVPEEKAYEDIITKATTRQIIRCIGTVNEYALSSIVNKEDYTDATSLSEYIVDRSGAEAQAGLCLSLLFVPQCPISYDMAHISDR